MIHAVISVYKKPIVWSLKLLDYVDKIFIYDHSEIMGYNKFILNNDKYYYEQIPNYGCEATAYLKYIIDNYNNLPDKIILLHDEQFSWHHKGDIIELIKNNVNSEDDYINLNTLVWMKHYNNTFPKGDLFYNWYNKFYSEYYGTIDYAPNFRAGYQGCAQFIIKPKCILRNPIKLYSNIYDFTMNENKTLKEVGYFMEFTWHIVFGQYNPLQKIMKGEWQHYARNIKINNNIITADIYNKKEGKYNLITIDLDEEYKYTIYDDKLSLISNKNKTDNSVLLKKYVKNSQSIKIKNIPDKINITPVPIKKEFSIKKEPIKNINNVLLVKYHTMKINDIKEIDSFHMNKPINCNKLSLTIKKYKK